MKALPSGNSYFEGDRGIADNKQSKYVKYMLLFVNFKPKKKKKKGEWSGEGRLQY